MDLKQITREGKEALEQEREHLIHVDRPNNLEQLAAARAQGDLSENADYDAAKKEQGEIESRIQEITQILDNCVVVEQAENDGKTVQFGSNVTIEDLSDGTIDTYFICNSVEVDIFKNKISVESPLATAIMGRQVGDIATVKCHSPYDVKIMEIK